MTRLLDISFNGFRFDDDDDRFERSRLEPAEERSPTYDQRYDFKTLIYDTFFDEVDGQVVIVCPRFRNFKNIMMEEASFEVDGAPVNIEAVKTHGRGDVLGFGRGLPAAKIFSIRHEHFSANIPVGPRLFDEFRGQNAILSISKDNQLSWIKDWLRYYIDEHGASSLLLFDNQSTAYSMEELGDALTSVDGLETAMLARAWYPFGPGGQGTVNHDSKFLHMMLFEIARLRFLGGARCVLNVDIDELVYSRSGRTVFDATLASSRGYLRLDGKWAYPARSEKDRVPQHADHRLVNKERDPVNRKWCVVPNGPAGTLTWKTHRIISRRDPTTPEFGFWHCRSISNNWDYDRTGWDNAALVEEHRLCSTMARVFGHPASPPSIGRPTPSSPRTLIGATKDDGPYLLEWIAYHQAIGFGEIHIHSADDENASLALLQRLDDIGAIRLFRHKIKRRNWVKAVAQRALDGLDTTVSGWALFQTTKDFLSIKSGDGGLDDLLQTSFEADLVHMPVKVFGLDGRVEYADASILEACTGALLPGASPEPDEDVDMRTMFAVRGGYEGLTLTAPTPYFGTIDDFDASDPSGSLCLGAYAGSGDDVAQINHYRYRSLNGWLCEVANSGEDEPAAIALASLEELRRPVEADASIQRVIPLMKDKLRALKQDNLVRRLHREAVIAHSTEVQDAIAQPGLVEARTKIMSELHLREADNARRDVQLNIANLRDAIENFADAGRAGRALEKLDRIEKILKL